MHSSPEPTEAGVDPGPLLYDLSGTRVPIPGTTNVRDLGGLPTARGKIRPGVLFRGEALAYPGPGVTRVAEWDDSALADYRALGLATVIDLRADHEAELAPSAWAQASSAVLETVPINEGGEGDATDYVRQLRAGTLRSFTAEDLGSYYADTVRRRAAQLGHAIGLVAHRDRVPVLVHCAAGKDRTGLLIALVLEVLGTPRELVVADYALTGVFRPNRVQAYADVLTASGIQPADVSALFETPALAMEGLLASLDAEFGSVRQFLLERAALTAKDLDLLEDVLVEPTV